eukprot:TRINITY_DN484_c0_g3_i1.p1 TRINITY_DN484_c0_g3~~TRINITY_DN484_c0_g3_i1.p1  ORF type:complete len:314 (-),score=51.87 TRINITY_DN484_c0_g3_i1:87-1028(-)
MSGIKDKVVLITGASSGIGRATAEVLAKKGAKVVLGARRTDNLEALVDQIRKTGGIAHHQKLDVVKQNEVSSFVDFALQTHGRVDVLINNAGIMPLSFFSDLKVEEWDQMIDVNIRGVLYGIATVLPIMKKQGVGQIINISSTAGHSVKPKSGLYSATKSAVLAISEGLRLENNNIRVTVISPGVTGTELANSISDPKTKEAVEKLIKAVAIPPERIADAIAYAIEQLGLLCHSPEVSLLSCYENASIPDFCRITVFFGRNKAKSCLMRSLVTMRTCSLSLCSQLLRFWTCLPRGCGFATCCCQRPSPVGPLS